MSKIKVPTKYKDKHNDHILDDIKNCDTYFGIDEREINNIILSYQDFCLVQS